jgi:hypothetical protein
MHGQGIIGYFSGKNGVGLRIFLNRAASSIGERTRRTGEKILAFPPASSAGEDASPNEPAFKVPSGDLESSDTGNKSRAPKSGADTILVVEGSHNQAGHTPDALDAGVRPSPAPSQITNVLPLEDAVTRLRAELEPALRAAARQAAVREHERTREWLESRGLPKAARVAQHETYNVLRKFGVIKGSSHPSRLQAEIGPNTCAAPGPRPISDDEVTDFAQACLAMLETQGRPVEVTLSEMGSGAGGFLLPEDALRVREKANSLLTAINRGKE